MLGAAHQLGARGTVDTLGTILGIALAALAAYGAVALLVEDGTKHTRLPLFRRGTAKRSLEGSLRDQFRELAHEAGVRDQL